MLKYTAEELKVHTKINYNKLTDSLRRFRSFIFSCCVGLCVFYTNYAQGKVRDKGRFIANTTLLEQPHVLFRALAVLKLILLTSGSSIR